MAGTQTGAPARLGRTALWLHGLGIAFLLAGIAALLFVGGDRNEGYTFLAFGGAGFVVLSLWSLVLAVRSYFANERSVAAYAVVLVILLEVTLAPFAHTGLKSSFAKFGGELWLSDPLHALVRNCVPAFTLLLFLIIGAGLPLARRLARKADAAEQDALRRRYFKRFAIVSALVLCVPFLAAFSFLSLELGDGSALNAVIARHVPVWISDRFETLVHSSAGTSELQNALLYQGCVSAERLTTRLADGNAVHFDYALHGISVSYPDQEKAACLQIGRQDHPYRCAHFHAASMLCRKLTADDLHAILAANSEYKPAFVGFLLSRVSERNLEQDFSVEIVKFAAEQPKYRREVSSFDFQDPTAKSTFQNTWDKLFQQKDWTGRTGLAYVIPYLECPLPQQLPFFQQCLNDADARMQRAAMSSACLGRTEFHWESAEPDDARPWLKALLPLLDHKDIFIRRSAVHVIATFTGLTVSATPDESALTEHADWTPAPPASGEEEEREAARAAAKTWLAEHQ